MTPTRSSGTARRGDACHRVILTDAELVDQALDRDAETVLRWWRQLTHDLHFRCRSDELPEILEEILQESSDAGREAA